MNEDIQLIRSIGVPRPRRREAWARIVECWRQSGLSAAQFAQQHGLRVDGLRGWRDKLQQPTSSATAAFVELDASSLPTTAPLEVHAGGLRVLVHRHCDGDLLRNVIHILQERSC